MVGTQKAIKVNWSCSSYNVVLDLQLLITKCVRDLPKNCWEFKLKKKFTKLIKKKLLKKVTKFYYRYYNKKKFGKIYVINTNSLQQERNSKNEAL